MDENRLFDALPRIRQDSLYDHENRVYSSARKAATPEQKKHLDAELRRRGIRTSRTK